jgi:hypothetical protein
VDFASKNIMKTPTLKVSEEYYEFHFENGFVYDIPKDDCKTERRINEWIAHLSEKNWWSEQLEAEFISVYKKVNEKII